jgi:glutamyl-tRNA synthetase
MHLGNARTALLAWLDARARGGRVVLRVEDLDTTRCTPALAALVRADLAWLGLDWDEETPPQSSREAAYAAAVQELAAGGSLFECFCTRRELMLASAPHDAADAGRRCAGGCRHLGRRDAAARVADGRRPALRVALPDAEVTFADRLHGAVTENPGRTVGDMVVRRSDGLHAYQLAVVIDDAQDGVTDVVRGDDLLSSTARQIALQRLLGLPTPAYAHVPLLLGCDGERLAKRHGSPSVADLRSAGRDPGEVVGMLASSLGLAADGERVAAADLAAGFRLDEIARAPSAL